jgi:hypothetical protein
MLTNKEIGQMIINDMIIVENILSELVRKIKIFDEKEVYKKMGLHISIAIVLYDMMETIDKKVYERYPEIKAAREYFRDAQRADLSAAAQLKA